MVKLICKWIILLFAILISACSEHLESNTQNSSGSITPSITWISSDDSSNRLLHVPRHIIVGQGTILPPDLSTVRIIVTGTGISKPISVNFAASTRKGNITDIPVGNNLTVTVQGLNNNGVIIYEGAQNNIVVNNGSATLVAITAIEVVNHPPEIVNPVTPLTKTEVFGPFTIKSGSDGALELDGVEFNLKSNSMNVVDIQRDQSAVNLSCNDGISINGNITSNYSTGVVNLNMVLNGQSVSCTANFQPILPFTIAGKESITDLLQDWGSKYGTVGAPESGLLKTTCPASVDNDIKINIDTMNCSGTFLSNYTVTDDTGGVHKLSTEFSISSSSSSTSSGGTSSSSSSTSTSSSSSSTSTSSTSSSGGGSADITFSGDGISDLPGAEFVSADVADSSDFIVWLGLDSNATNIIVKIDPGTTNVVSVAVQVTNGGFIWTTDSPVGVSVTATEVTFNNTSVPNLTPSSQPIVLNGTLSRQ